jgi:hypothetical protein
MWVDDSGKCKNETVRIMRPSVIMRAVSTAGLQLRAPVRARVRRRTPRFISPGSGLARGRCGRQQHGVLQRANVAPALGVVHQLGVKAD